jgi:hypothetical protein
MQITMPNLGECANEIRAEELFLHLRAKREDY